ncbi:related to Transmembrane 9 superfamily member 3 [Saccharomycodes ludwigii]|uniref:Transmembrane 9 superfamily member n=2 Tax=Saccharomycodes ludwigii TaxID=36035 RepID=A0A376BBM4_9ASCO|nr:related to Transmembrane 9 superfamily member 3 [Saccharomycodes ludwigii]
MPYHHLSTSKFSTNTDFKTIEHLQDYISNGAWIKPNVYHTGDKVELLVNKIVSEHNPIPHAYYDLPFVCPPQSDKKPLHLSLMEILGGDRKWQSDYKLFFKKDQQCARLCDRIIKPWAVNYLIELIKQEYMVKWLIDDELPGATTFISTIDHKKYYTDGFPLGFIDESTGKVFINNHVMLVIRYRTEDYNRFTILGFEVYPKSTADAICPGGSKNYKHFELVNFEEGATMDEIRLPFTYSVYWREELKHTWRNRWQYFIDSKEISEWNTSKLHWIALLNSAFIASIACSIVLFIYKNLVSTKQSIKKNDNSSMHLVDERNINTSVRSGSLLKYNIIRHFTNTSRVIGGNKRSRWFNLLSLLISCGVQSSCILLGFILISCSLNKLHNIGGTVYTFAVSCFITGCILASFIGVLLLNYGIDDTSNLSMKRILLEGLVCGSFVPLLTLCLIIFFNSIVWITDSSHVLPFKTVVLLVGAYCIICIPLSLVVAVFTKLFLELINNGRASVTTDSSTSDSVVGNDSSGDIANKLKGNNISISDIFITYFDMFMNICTDNNDNNDEMTTSNGFNLSPSPSSTLSSTPYANFINVGTITDKNASTFMDNPILLILIFGIVPFTVIYVELLSIYKSIWAEKAHFYYLYGFLLANLGLLCLSICSISIIGTCLHFYYSKAYLRLQDGDQSQLDTITSPSLRNRILDDWKWQSFFIGGSVAWYLEIYSIYYVFFVLKITDFSSIFLFICFTALFNGFVLFAFGSLGFISSCFFICKVFHFATLNGSGGNGFFFKNRHA